MCYAWHSDEESSSRIDRHLKNLSEFTSIARRRRGTQRLPPPPSMHTGAARMSIYSRPATNIVCNTLMHVSSFTGCSMPVATWHAHKSTIEALAASLSLLGRSSPFLTSLPYLWLMRHGAARARRFVGRNSSRPHEGLARRCISAAVAT
eukprot:265427-Chlamydomonas_euryale.AAC.4